MELANQLTIPSEALFQSEALGAVNVPRDEQYSLNEEKSSFHGVRFENLGLIIQPGVIGEVVENIEMCRLPLASSLLIGMAYLRGTIVPVFDLHQILSIKPPEKKQRVLVLERNGSYVGFRIESLPQKVSLEKEHCIHSIPPLPEKLKPYIEQCYEKEDIWLKLDIFGLLKEVGKSV